ncbi:uncharacterized protein EDB93DRAFT_1127198 [Suillus bovinus]|uniref:uncharacterized protein n=1 Tax=Suillus bovinus TaxID=48563 RepID=UPI001B86AF41|nr:uncharacterized protein EDB93DRAFT_1127198 [Suillus bovinus]KAG2156531.1 hypothetical protein EDB93DRAFT_1127198 [Suillus bovinus]
MRTHSHTSIVTSLLLQFIVMTLCYSFHGTVNCEPFPLRPAYVTTCSGPQDLTLRRAWWTFAQKDLRMVNFAQRC